MTCILYRLHVVFLVWPASLKASVYVTAIGGRPCSVICPILQALKSKITSKNIWYMLLFEYDLGWLDVFDFDEYVSACCTWPVVCRWMEHSNTADYAVSCAWHCMMRVMRRIRLQTTEYLIEHNFHIVSVLFVSATIWIFSTDRQCLLLFEMTYYVSRRTLKRTNLTQDKTRIYWHICSLIAE